MKKGQSSTAGLPGAYLHDSLQFPAYTAWRDKDLLFRSARLTLQLSGESTLPITKKDNPGRGSSQEQEIYHERGRR
ncbi:MAG: hypothetical protein NTU60_06815, partial [Candidatus Aminicenantes bacterium]|nr:hypothetical protein [Candidatus Aminicenantes bacterium]